MKAMFAAISSFKVENGLEGGVQQAFNNRPGLVENFDGSIRLGVLSPSKNPSEIWLLTYWKNEESFKSWHSNHVKDWRKGISKGLKLVPHSFKLRFLNHLAS